VYRLNIPVARANIVQPPSGETKVTIAESVRDYDVYILNTVSRIPTTHNGEVELSGSAPVRSTPPSSSFAS
jgi:phosphoribosylpyrophosphate synthetase